MTTPHLIPQLVDYAKEFSADHLRLIEKLAQPTPSFISSEFLDGPVRSAWGQLSMDARLLAYVWMQERSAEDTRRGEASL